MPTKQPSNRAVSNTGSSQPHRRHKNPVLADLYECVSIHKQTLPLQRRALRDYVGPGRLDDMTSLLRAVSAFLLCTSVVSVQTPTDISSLLARVRDHQDALDKMRENFAYTEMVTSIETDKKGKQRKRESKTFEATFYKHRKISRLVARDEKPLSAADASKEERRIEKLISDLDAGHASADPDADRQMRISTLLRAERFSNPRKENFRGRDVVVFDFSPDPQFRPKNTYENFYRQMAGTMWIDGADLQVARVEIKLIGAFKVGGGAFFEMKRGASFISENARFFDEIWLPTRSESVFDARAILLYSFGVRETTEFKNYYRFDVNTQQKIAAPKPPPNTRGRDSLR